MMLYSYHIVRVAVATAVLAALSSIPAEAQATTSTSSKLSEQRLKPTVTRAKNPVAAKRAPMISSSSKAGAAAKGTLTSVSPHGDKLVSTKKGQATRAVARSPATDRKKPTPDMADLLGIPRINLPPGSIGSPRCVGSYC
jgi:hypothetical protein